MLIYVFFNYILTILDLPQERKIGPEEAQGHPALIGHQPLRGRFCEAARLGSKASRVDADPARRLLVRPLP